MDGIILINKEKGCTSHGIVNKVKHILNEKVGHTGTLDPNATGLLPILVGKGTKISQYLINHDKEYEVELKLGIKTDTADIEGKILEEKNVEDKIFERENIIKTLNKFIGRQKQIPPIYSAIKINGKKLYEYAREGKKVEIPEREIEIYSIKLKNINLEEKEIEFEVNCSKGTYIRVLCEDIANKLDTVGYMSNLERIKVDDFDIRDSVTLEDLEKNKDNKMFLERSLINMETIFKDLPQISLNNRKKELFLNGVMLSIENKEGLYNIYNNNVYLGTGTIKNNLLKRDVII